MTIATETRRAGPYSGNGSTQVFAFSFKCYAAADLVVVTTTSGVDTVKTLTTHYTVSLNSNQNTNPGGSITMLTAPASGTTLVITTDQSYLQELLLVNAGAWLPEALNDAFDKQTIFHQQNRYDIDRSVRGAISDAAMNRLPVASVRADGLLGFDADGQPEIVDIGSVEGMIADIATVAGIAAEIEIVAAADVDIATVADNITDVNTVADWIGTGGGLGAGEVIAQGTSTTRARTLSNRHGDVINLEDTLLDFDDDEADNAAELATLIEEAAFAGKKLVAPRLRTLWVGACAAAPEGDVTWEAVPGFMIKGIAGFSGPVVEIDGGAFLPRFWVDGLIIDNSLREFVTAEQSGTALSIKRMIDMDIRRFVAQSTDDYRDEFGDSGITIQECRAGRIWNPVIIGQPDLGIYVTGGASTGDTDDYADIEIYGARIYRCDQAISSKRQGRRVAVFGGVVNECRVGISCLEAGTSPQVDPGRELYVGGTRFKRIGARALWGRGNCRITGKIDVEDFGFDPDDVANADGHTYAVRLEGPSHCDIEATIRQRDWSGSGLQAFDIRALTLTSGTYTPKSNRIKATINGVATGVQEGTGVTANDYDLVVDTVTTPVSLASGSKSKFRVLDQAGDAYGTQPEVIQQSGAAAALTGTTTETVLATINVKGGRMGANGRLRINATTACTNSVNDKTFRIRVTDTSGTVLATHLLTASAASQFSYTIRNANSQSAQVGGTTGGAGGWGGGSVVSSGAINTANDFVLVITGQLENSGESLTLTGYDVELLYGA